jgi:hypothetical protein
MDDEQLCAEAKHEGAAREAVWILFCDLPVENRDRQRAHEPRPQDRSVAELNRALQRLHAERPEDFRYIGNLRRSADCRVPLGALSIGVQECLGPILSSLASHMSTPVIVAERHLGHWLDDGIRALLQRAWDDQEDALRKALGEVECTDGRVAAGGTGADHEGQLPPGRLDGSGRPGTADRFGPLGISPWDGARECNHGFRIVQGPTGNPAGRQPRGTDRPERGAQLIEERGMSIERARACLGPGRPTEQRRQERQVLAHIVAKLRDAGRARPEALAAALGCSTRTIRDLAADGRERGHGARGMSAAA